MKLCPVQDECLMGPILFDQGVDWTEKCPLYLDHEVKNNILRIRCKNNEHEKIVCPVCNDPNLFFDKTILYICKNCCTYITKSRIKGIRRQGKATPVRCDCGQNGWSIPPTSSLEEILWRCPNCGQVSDIEDIAK